VATVQAAEEAKEVPSGSEKIIKTVNRVRRRSVFLLSTYPFSKDLTPKP